MEKEKTTNPILKSIDLVYYIKYIAIFLFIIQIMFNIRELFILFNKPNPEIPQFIVIIYTLLVGIKVIGVVLMYSVFTKGEQLLKSLLNNKMFDDNIIKRFDILLNLLIKFYILYAISTVSLQGALLILVVMAGITKEIFVYGNKLEKEVAETI